MTLSFLILAINIELPYEIDRTILGLFVASVDIFAHYAKKYKLNGSEKIDA